MGVVIALGAVHVSPPFTKNPSHPSIDPQPPPPLLRPPTRPMQLLLPIPALVHRRSMEPLPMSPPTRAMSPTLLDRNSHPTRESPGTIPRCCLTDHSARPTLHTV